MPDHIQNLLPLACKWVEEQEQFILANGIPLNEDQLIDAFLVGVKEPKRVRLLNVREIPFPASPEMQAALHEIGMTDKGSIGLSLRYGIFLKEEHWQSRRVIVHELVHTAQYERLGSIENFMRQYVEECVTFDYMFAPLEREARQIEKKICG